MVSSEVQVAEKPEQSIDDYSITIRDCNSITKAEISLRRSALNIKYGPNGLGKSTIARALELRAKGQGALSALAPFKYRDGKNHPSPTVEGADDIEKVLIFNDSYVSQFVFQRDEVLKNSFEIFINTEEYKQGLEEIESMFGALKDTFSEQEEFEAALTSFIQLRDAFGLTKAGGISKTSRGFKALSMGGRLANIPEPLIGYQGFLHGHDPAGWVAWQSNGKAYLDLSDNCPFCSTGNVNKETARKVSEVYESAAVKNMSVLRASIDRVGHYFEQSYLKQLNEVTSQLSELRPEQAQFLASLRGDVETFLAKLTGLKSLSFHALRDEENLATALDDLKIDLTLLRSLNSEATQSVVKLISDKLDQVAKQINDIQARVGKQKSQVARLIKANQDGINQFLESAGYRYSVCIKPEADSYRMILEHHDLAGHLEEAASHLSYGERNAFALVLFMHHVRRDRPDLVVLDDPVSSFDKTKKFAILHQLFHGRNSIRDFTSLLLTHDIEPAIDIVKTGTASQFTAAKPAVHFLSSRSGIVSEKLIEKKDISTFSQVCDRNIASSLDDVIKCIYLRRRYEVHGDLGAEYDILSSLLHLRPTPDRPGDNGEREELQEAELALGLAEIKKFIPDFDYDAIVGNLSDVDVLKAKFDATDVGYEKLQIFRIMSELKLGVSKPDDVFRKFVNESFHIENEYVMQLNPREYDAIPEYVVDACSKMMEEATV